ncbi:PKD domain-containing protein, partial [Lentimicrobium sp.]|uniref:PKD domain-containing protein n=1 Tax=Lentimicrobium sp. TaxID=2034841 RepID=UPI002CA9836F
MKKIKNLTLLLLLFMTGIVYSYGQQPYIVLSGHVLNQQTGEPVVNQPVFISVDSMNYPGYFNEVITDGAGYYSDNLPYIYGGTPGSVTVTTADCNGIMISRSAALLPGMQQLVLDFNICGNMGSGCTALFRYMPGSNDMLTVSFFDESYPAPGVIINSWFWDFGDGNTSSAQNPVHTYSEPGLYNACLFISSNDSSCNSSFCMPVDAGSINPGGCENYFWYLPDSSGTGYTFEGFVMNGEAESYIWDFGDGTTANGQTVFHQFADTNMVHNVCLTTTSILNGDVCTSVSCQEVFSYFPSPCESYFWYYTDSTGTGYTFEGYTMGSQVESWTWDFGDGTTASGQSVTHTFDNPNEIYTVCLTTTGTGPDNEPCTYTSCQEVFIYLPSPCESYFWYYPDSTGTGYTFEGYTMGSQVESWT